MIERGDDTVERERTPWDARDPLAALAFAVVSATGPDPLLDGVFRVQALRRDPLTAGFAGFERLCRPRPDRELDAATLRALREHGVEPEDLAGAPSPAEALSDLRAFLGDRTVVVPEREAFAAWCSRLGGGQPGVTLGLDQLRALLAAPPRSAGGPRTPTELARALAEVAARVLRLEGNTLRILSASWLATWRALAGHDDETAAVLRLAIVMLERPSFWLDAAGPGVDRLPDGLVTHALGRWSPLAAADAVRDLAEGLRPRCAELGDEVRVEPTVPVRQAESPPLAECDAAIVDDVFRVHLPALADDGGSAMLYREGQHAVAREVACALGERELLLVHAPTGTGKTLAYLVPALLWAMRQGQRVGISTYTRALQQQAMQREVPRAIAALVRAGVREVPRVALLKGRQNYLCWRALRAHAPSGEDGAGAWLAWCALLAFALTDDDGDLDRFPQRLSVTPVPRASYERELEAFVRGVRAQNGCCTDSAERTTCAADIAREVAERAHVVITNHAFVLARQEYFKTVVFDECEHLHDQAHSAWSHELALATVSEYLERLGSGAGRSQRAPLDRLSRAILPGSQAAAAHAECREARALALEALAALQGELERFKQWRAEFESERSERSRYALLREWIEVGDSAELVEAKRELYGSFVRLEAAHSLLVEELASVAARGIPRMRRALERSRSDALAIAGALEAWLPVRDGVVELQPETFYDVEEDVRGGDVLAARVLLPNEYLGSRYYPQLDRAVFLSATTWLRAGFESALGYLGLDRAAEPLEGEVRSACSVRTFRAADPFDWSRVRVFVPEDAPEYASERERYHEYVRRFVAHLAERTRGRMLVLFTNSDDLRRTALGLEDFFRERRIPFWWQNMQGASKEELGDLFRSRLDSVLMGVDTFWYGADFAGETLEYLVIVKLPWGVPDRYHHAQCAALGEREQRRRIYLPRALAKFRQGFGRLMRRESDRGCVFVLDARILRGQNRLFLGELPLAEGFDDDPAREWRDGGARMKVAPTEACVEAALAHMEVLEEARRRGLDAAFELPPGRASRPWPSRAPPPRSAAHDRRPRAPRPTPPRPREHDFPASDLPF